MGLYDRYLALRIRLADETLPETVALVITEQDLLETGAYETLSEFFAWAFEYGANRVVVYVSVSTTERVSRLVEEFGQFAPPREMAIRTPADEQPADTPIQVSIGLGGKHEFAQAVQSIATAVEEESLHADAVTEEVIEDRLVFPANPDLVIKTGAERLSDFMIWQSVYAELHFTDVNWRNFRRREYLRALRDYQTRQRRFGK